MLESEKSAATRVFEYTRTLERGTYITATQVSEAIGEASNKVSAAFFKLRNLGAVSIIGTKGRADHYRIDDTSRVPRIARRRPVYRSCLADEAVVADEPIEAGEDDINVDLLFRDIILLIAERLRTMMRQKMITEYTSDDLMAELRRRMSGGK